MIYERIKNLMSLLGLPLTDSITFVGLSIKVVDLVALFGFLIMVYCFFCIGYHWYVKVFSTKTLYNTDNYFRRTNIKL